MSEQKVLYVNEDLHHRLKIAATAKKMTLTAFVEMILDSHDRHHKCDCEKGCVK